MEYVVKVTIISDRAVMVKLVVGVLTLNKVSVYAPQLGLDTETKRLFLEDMDSLIPRIPTNQKTFIRGKSAM